MVFKVERDDRNICVYKITRGHGVGQVVLEKYVRGFIKIPNQEIYPNNYSFGSRNIFGWPRMPDIEIDLNGKFFDRLFEDDIFVNYTVDNQIRQKHSFLSNLFKFLFEF